MIFFNLDAYADNVQMAAANLFMGLILVSIYLTVVRRQPKLHQEGC